MTLAWPSAPAVRRGAPALSLPTIAVSAAVLAVLGPVLRAAALPASEPKLVALASTAAVVAVLLVPRRMWWARLGIALATGIFLVPSQGQTIPLWVAAGLALTPWVTRDRPPLPLLPKRGTPALVPCLVLAAVAARMGTEPSRTWQMLVPVAVACVLPLATSLIASAMGRVTRGFDAIVTPVVDFVAYPILAVIAIVPAWAVQRPLGLDPRRMRQGWTALDRRPVRSDRPWAPDAAHDPRPANQRVRSGVAFTAVAALVLVGTWFVRAPKDTTAYVGGPADSSLSGAAPSPAGAAAAHRGDDWYPDYQQDIAWALDEKVALRPFELYKLWDVKTRTVNVTDNHRVSWQPPACDCRRLTVWLYGGGGAFGFEQRDDHTIASELARVALQDGLTVDVVNRGIPGQNHEQAATRFAWDLAGGDKPDLAIFYEGAEDVAAADALNDPPVGNTGIPYEAYRDGLWRDLKKIKPVPPKQAQPFGFAWPTVPKRTPAEVGKLAATSYVRTLGPSDDSAAGYQVPVRYFWEPTRYTRPGPEAPSAAGPAVDQNGAETFAAAAAALPDRVTDLSHAFDGVDSPLFADAIHPNERGAHLVAVAIYRSISDQLHQIERGGHG